MISARLARLVLVCLALILVTAISASADIVYTTPASDGSTGRDIWYGGSYYYGMDSTYSSAVIRDFYAGYSPGGLWGSYSVAILQFPISSL